MEPHISLRLGIASGTVLSIVPSIYPDDIAKTVILAAVGATVSFIMSVLFKLVIKKRKNNNDAK